MGSNCAAICWALRHAPLLACSLLSAQPLYAQSIYAQPYTFTTLAGNAGYGSADGPGANARFNAPLGVARDSAGNLYVADSANHTIRKITPGGVVSTLAGLAGVYGSADGPGATARFKHPRGVALDSAGNLYVADYYNYTLRKITPGGVVSTLAGLAGCPGSADGTGANARFNCPRSVAVDSAGNLYVADDYPNHTIRKITPEGVVSTLAGLAEVRGSADGSGTNAQFNCPSGVTVDSVGNVYVADTGNHTLRKITPGGLVSTLAGLAGSSGSVDGFCTDARFNNPYGVVVDGTGNLYVADTGNHTLRELTSGGVVTTLAGLAGSSGSVDGPGTNARFNGPMSVAVDGPGTVYVADYGNNTIRQLTPAEVVSTLAGRAAGPGSTDGPGADARFNLPSSAAVDSAGTVYVADSANHTIRKLAPGGEVSTLAGRAGIRGSVDGMGTNAQFNCPRSVAVDSAGTVYVADYYNNSLRKITPGGVVSTLVVLTAPPSVVAVDRADNLYVVEDYTNVLCKLSPGGGLNFVAWLAGPTSGVAVDSLGNIYATSSSGHVLWKLSPGGGMRILAGLTGDYGSADGPGSEARFHHPSGVAVDSADNLYVADTFNSTLRKVTPAGVVSTLAGLAGVYGSADGTGANARFNYPTGVAVDSAGNVFVADTDNSTLRLGRPAPAPPVLGIRPVDGQLILSWPLEASNFLVEASSTLAPAAGWLPLTDAVGTDENGCVLTNRLETGARFFRLRLP